MVYHTSDVYLCVAEQEESSDSLFTTVFLKNVRREFMSSVAAPLLEGPITEASPFGLLLFQKRTDYSNP